MNVIEVGSKVLWPHRTACSLCQTVVELDPADINQKTDDPTRPGWWQCPRCGARPLVPGTLAAAARFEVARLIAAEKKREPFDAEGNATTPLYSDDPALSPKVIDVGRR